MYPILDEALPTASVALLNYVLAELDPDRPSPFTGNTGLPYGVECRAQNLIVSITPVTERLYDSALIRCAETRNRDVMLIRSGFQPETLDPVRVDVALLTAPEPLLLTDLSFFRHATGRLHLTPSGADLSLGIACDGLKVQISMPWTTDWERMAGLEYAAAQIVRGCRQRPRG